MAPTDAGSINKVFPVEDLSITLPFIRNLNSFFTGTHRRPFRTVLKLSDIHSLLALITESAFSRMPVSVLPISSRRDRSSLEALSSTRPLRMWR